MIIASVMAILITRTGIPNRIDIDQRSDAVNNREVFA
jgi:hypothetical protein